MKERKRSKKDKEKAGNRVKKRDRGMEKNQQHSVESGLDSKRKPQEEEVSVTAVNSSNTLRHIARGERKPVSCLIKDETNVRARRAKAYLARGSNVWRNTQEQRKKIEEKPHTLVRRSQWLFPRSLVSRMVE
ncbi:hypothetical protein NDU88_000719 [Pleurodeles waltl]|uniref:Uncharacterized protein n=1 Tax=Pleurodeles waltl TaxID=8319 RepID=A0AAV7KNI7_PLEWA|nr:hypothetical protein NDU88_000719 [Pleurodeles waltl]